MDTDAALIRHKSSQVSGGGGIESDAESLSQAELLYVAIRDVIKSIGVVARKEERHDLLLIGCPCSVIIYDVQAQSHLINIRTSASIDGILVPDANFSHDELSGTLTRLAICAGPQKLYTVKFGIDWEDSELTSERSTSGSTITCMTTIGLGSSVSWDFFLLTGSRDGDQDEYNHGYDGSASNESSRYSGTICLYQLDLLDQTNNIQACRLRITESAPISCLRAIPTHLPKVAESRLSAVVDENNEDLEKSPATNEPIQTVASDFFAYGLENGLLGVYRLIIGPEGDTREPSVKKSIPQIVHERLWRHKCKCTPTSMELFDVNGDGFDELIVGFQGGRLEVRAPLTGQLLGAIRLANPIQSTLGGISALRSDRAAQLSRVGLVQLRATAMEAGCWLLAGTGRGSITAFRPIAAKPRQPVQGAWSARLPDGTVETGASDWSRRAKRTIAQQLSIDGDAVASELDGAKQTTHLHIESPPPPPSAQDEPALAERGGCRTAESGQSDDLLQKINSLYVERLDLRQRLGRALVSRRSTSSGSRRQASSSSVGGGGSESAHFSVRHSWDFDRAKVS